MSKKRLYIAYGSNLNLPQMALRCPTAKPVGTAVIKDYELLFRGWRRGGVATVEPREGSAVPVLVWDIKPKDEVALDHYEGYPNFYGKRMMEVELDGKPVSAMVYVMTPGHDAGYPSDYYLNVIAEGYKTAGFDLGVLDDAVERTEEIMAAEMEKLAAELEQDDGQCTLFDMKWRW
jgi:cation transport regulator ChaC